MGERARADSPEALAALLETWSYERVPQVYSRGQFAWRGGIMDIFSWQHALPVRVEFFGDAIESLREFDPEGQRSIRRLDEAEILPPPDTSQTTTLRTLLAPLMKVWIDPPEVPPEAGARDVVLLQTPGESPSPLRLPELPEAAFSAGDFVLNEAKRERFLAQMAEWWKEGWQIAVFCDHEGERARLDELLREGGLHPERLLGWSGLLEHSFLCPAWQLAVLSDADLFGRSIGRRLRRTAQRRERLLAARATDDLSHFEEGDFVVHAEHGIGRYLGLQPLPGEGTEVLALEFANDSRLFIPVEEAWQISRYIGLGKKRPELSDLGSGKWDRAKHKTRQAVFEYARTMLALQAERETTGGFACPPDSAWQQEFEQAFPFKETPDQLRAIDETKQDMESTKPMDRLICGDVGFGKTEVAIRAAFKAVMAGKQVAFLAPTTVLAQQHYENLRERLSEFPIQVACLTRYRTAAEQGKTLAALAEGRVDILVGTHRLISPDVRWKELGLLIVDEEQRFGVRQKELLKERFRLVDVLTLSATPIPRTLYLALMGARDMSVIETPPPNRQPVETIICGYDERTIREAVAREKARGGQVYLLHNRVATIERLAARVRELVPGIRVEVGHGQMPEGELEEVMERFISGKTDVLVSTTIIESGLDIPNANTIIIDRADLFGLADLYQLRGRVGRSGVKAYAYLMLPKSLLTVGEARKRISAIKQYSELGAGFKIAMRDLEIRGAGNLLGTAQSGHIIAVGFDLYCRMLKQAVHRLSGGGAQPFAAALHLDFVAFTEGEFFGANEPLAPAFLPVTYIAEAQARIEAYRLFHEARTLARLEEVEAEWKDRYGTLAPAVQNLLLTARVRLTAGERGITAIETRGPKLMLTRRGDYLLIGHKFPRLEASDPTARLQELYQLVLAVTR